MVNMVKDNNIILKVSSEYDEHVLSWRTLFFISVWPNIIENI
jgi:hypothetical protein